jgi:hypothetical protein
LTGYFLLVFFFAKALAAAVLLFLPVSSACKTFDAFFAAVLPVDLFDFSFVCERALPAADLLSSAVLPSRSTFEAAVAAFLVVVFFFVCHI